MGGGGGQLPPRHVISTEEKKDHVYVTVGIFKADHQNDICIAYTINLQWYGAINDS